MSESEEIQEILEHLSVLAPLSEDTPPASAVALTRLKGRLTPPVLAEPNRNRSRNIMSNKRLSIAGLTFIMAIALMMAFPSVRAAAGEFLGLFRVQKFAPISVSPQQMALLGQLQEQGLSPGELVMVSEPGEPTAVDTLETAAQLTGYQLHRLTDRDQPVEIYVMGDASGYLDVDLAGARAIVEAAGVDPLLLPDSLDGARVNVQTYDSVQQLYADGLMVMQTAAPDVTYPPDVDPTVLGQALLQVLGIEPTAARQLAQSIDWTSTMLLPIPQDLGSYREVTVDGTTGVAVEPFDPGSDPAIVWQSDGMVYMVTGPIPVDELINQANALQ